VAGRSFDVGEKFGFKYPRNPLLSLPQFSSSFLFLHGLRRGKGKRERESGEGLFEEKKPFFSPSEGFDKNFKGLFHQAVTPIDLWDVDREPRKRSLFLITNSKYSTVGAHLRFGG